MSYDARPGPPAHWTTVPLVACGTSASIVGLLLVLDGAVPIGIVGLVVGAFLVAHPSIRTRWYCDGYAAGWEAHSEQVPRNAPGMRVWRARGERGDQ